MYSRTHRGSPTTQQHGSAALNHVNILGLASPGDLLVAGSNGVLEVLHFLPQRRYLHRCSHELIFNTCSPATSHLSHFFCRCCCLCRSVEVLLFRRLNTKELGSGAGLGSRQSATNDVHTCRLQQQYATTWVQTVVPVT